MLNELQVNISTQVICRPILIVELWRQKGTELLMAQQQQLIFAGPSLLLNCDVRKAQNSLWHHSSRIYLQAHLYCWTVTSERHRTTYGSTAAAYICRPILITELWHQKGPELLMAPQQQLIFAPLNEHNCKLTSDSSRLSQHAIYTNNTTTNYHQIQHVTV